MYGATETKTAVERDAENRVGPVVELRSDTFTKPTPEMRRAMAEAEVGDDVYGEDPTVNRLQRRAAEIFGREAAIFVPSGSMGNTIAMKIWTRPGQDVITEELGHISQFEVGAFAALGGCSSRLVPSPDGILTWEMIERRLRPRAYDEIEPGLIALENTHNMRGGTVYPQAVSDEICDRARERGLPVHLDGARIFNAATALGKSVREITSKFDSVMFCLSKALGAPVGSMLVGSEEFIEKARLWRKIFGGGMRQAGVLAAAGLVALEKTPARLPEDHANAKYLAEGLAKIPGIKLDPSKVQTNIVIYDVRGTGRTGEEFCEVIAKQNVRATGAADKYGVRMVTHYDVDRAGIERALEVVRSIRKN
jgi:threonine aldolase